MLKRLVKGSKAAKDFMAKLRAKKVNGIKDTIKRKAISVKKNVAYSVIDKTLKSAQTKTAKDVLNRAKGIIKNTYLGSVALTKKGKPRKYLDKYQKEYNKMLDDYKYFVVHNNKVVEGNEYKSDAIDAANEYYPKAKVYTKLGLKKLGIQNNLSSNKYTLGSTLLINKGENPRKKPTRIIQVDRTKKGTFKKFKRISGVSKKHTDTKSHNINIKVGALPSYKDPDAAREIQLYADNDSTLYYQRRKPILINLSKKHKKGQYDIDKAAKLWRYYIDAAMQKYQKEFGGRGSWSNLLSVADRNVLANDYAINTLDEFELGNYTEK